MISELFLQMFFVCSDLPFNFNCTHLDKLQWSAQWRVQSKPTVHTWYTTFSFNLLYYTNDKLAKKLTKHSNNILKYVKLLLFKQ